MKVTVCFGAIRVVVPCGNGELLVRDLIRESIQRYKKASGKNSESWVVVHHLQSQSGILDPDDRVNDVADDREQILASYDDHLGPDPSVPQGGGDGASGSSSVGTGSPDIFRGVVETKFIATDENTPHIEVTDVTEPPPGIGLQVRRGSEPSLHQAVITEHRNQPFIRQQQDPTKRWSAAPVCRSDNDPPERILGSIVINPSATYLSPAWNVPENDMEESRNEISTSFTRSGRLSMQFLGDGAGYRWMDAADKVSHNNYNFNSKSLPRETKRKEPLGQAYESIREKDGEMLLIINECGGPLGLTAVPDSSNDGLLVQSVEPGSRAERGRLRRGDHILEINGTKLIGLSESTVQDHLRQCLTAPELRLRVVRGSTILNKLRKDNQISDLIKAAEIPSNTKVATVSPTRKAGANPTGHHGTSLQVANTRRLGRLIEITLRKGPHGLGFSVTTRDNPAGGDCPIYIKNILTRGAAIEDGRLKPGDRLLEVDEISMTGKTQTEVVGILRATQPGATVNIVVSRQQELGELDERQIGYFAEQELDQHNTPPKPPPPILPQKSTLKSSMRHKDYHNNAKIASNTNDAMNFSVINESGVSDSISPNDTKHIFPWRNREVFTLHIPVHDTEKAGLGVSVKGKTGPANCGSSSGGSSSSSGSGIHKHDGDLGIFIKSVLHGGAASRDGRLKMNDQLLSVNDVSLLGQNNAEAMETLRRAMLHTGGNFPGMITVIVARKISRSNSSGNSLEGDNSNTSEQSGATVIYLNSENSKQNINQFKIGNATIGPANNLCNNNNKRWSNPVLDRLTGGTGSNSPNNSHINRPSPLMTHGLRNDSYYIATNDNWSPPMILQNLQQQPHHTHPNSQHESCNLINTSVLIEEDPEPMSPTLPSRLIDVNKTISSCNSTIILSKSQQNSSTPITDATYASQLSLDTNTSAEAFSRDAVGRRSMSEKHHAALDARETGTYQRNKKIREERERERRTNLKGPGAGSVESLNANRVNLNQNSHDLNAEAMDLVGELGPSLGLKKSSSLESLQTMVQEIQMYDEPRGPNALRTPRGRGRDESLRAAVERPPESKPRKHWLLEEDINDAEGGFITSRNGPFQSSLNDGKNGKNRAKKPSILKGIGHMFRFGKHRKDGVAPAETLNDVSVGPIPLTTTTQPVDLFKHQMAQPQQNERPMGGPPMYQPPPPPITSNVSDNIGSSTTQSTTAGNHDQIFNQRYSHYVNYEELQQQISSSNDHLSESTIAQMRRQVMVQRGKVEEESRRYQHYHSQRSMRSSSSILHAQQQQQRQLHNDGETHGHLLQHSQSHHTIQRSNLSDKFQQQHQVQEQQRHQRPVSSYYEYETIQQNSQLRKLSAPTTPVKQQQQQLQLQQLQQWSHTNNNEKSETCRMISMEPTTKSTTTTALNGARNRGPFITQVTISEQHQGNNIQNNGRRNNNNNNNNKNNKNNNNNDNNNNNNNNNSSSRSSSTSSSSSNNNNSNSNNEIRRSSQQPASKV